MRHGWSPDLVASGHGRRQAPPATGPAPPTDEAALTPAGARPDVAAGEELPKPSRRTLILLVTPIVILSTAGTIATAFIPTLAARHPLLLIALDSRNRMLVLAREVDLVWFFTVAFLRRTLSDPLFYLLGMLYGDRAIRWLEKKGGGGALVTLTEGWFQKASYLMVFLFPGAIVCALAGATKMRPCGVRGVQRERHPRLADRWSASSATPSPARSTPSLRFFDRNLVLTTVDQRRPGDPVPRPQPGPGQARPRPRRAGGRRRPRRRSPRPAS